MKKMKSDSSNDQKQKSLFRRKFHPKDLSPSPNKNQSILDQTTYVQNDPMDFDENSIPQDNDTYKELLNDISEELKQDGYQFGELSNESTTNQENASGNDSYETLSHPNNKNLMKNLQPETYSLKAPSTQPRNNRKHDKNDRQRRKKVEQQPPQQEDSGDDSSDMIKEEDTAEPTIYYPQNKKISGDSIKSASSSASSASTSSRKSKSKESDRRGSSSRNQDSNDALKNLEKFSNEMKEFHEQQQQFETSADYDETPISSRRTTQETIYKSSNTPNEDKPIPARERENERQPSGSGPQFSKYDQDDQFAIFGENKQLKATVDNLKNQLEGMITNKEYWEGQFNEIKRKFEKETEIYSVSKSKNEDFSLKLKEEISKSRGYEEDIMSLRSEIESLKENYDRDKNMSEKKHQKESEFEFSFLSLSQKS